MISARDVPSRDVVARLLGEELQSIRRQRGWTRKQLQDRMPSRVSVQTLATYEMGTRQCSVTRLIELCCAMGVFAHELLAGVYERSAQLDWTNRLVLDLRRVVNDQQAALAPLRRWAQGQLDRLPLGQNCIVSLDLCALYPLAELCGMTTGELIMRLRELGDNDRFTVRVPPAQDRSPRSGRSVEDSLLATSSV